MARSVPEWIGKTDDTPVPPRVKLRVHDRHGGICPVCQRKLRSGHWDTDHIEPLALGGQNRESNLQPLCDVPCHSKKTRRDVAAKSASYKRQRSNAGIKRRARGGSFQTNRDGRYKQKIGGQVVLRED